jgi:hypothetical protein
MTDYIRHDVSEQESATLEVFDLIRSNIEVMRSRNIDSKKIVNVLSLAENINHFDTLVELTLIKEG